ncbi:hypothetical protein T440DRAFT_318257 [Plenodomus tracheiphilus IPT5]|uniref:Xylanolytic transcriptional activator regulatory domain-containing protein n=1 Tax=Plenodomus tracheiphilus IPT5 TaxID=1408161 RepID=A0A6A7BC34_9PLEO|nr:hypothetical protein T440DRAFT_318257 [Plenodomus tracheiphilus IPT5]
MCLPAQAEARLKAGRRGGLDASPFLERILLDTNGGIRPQFNVDDPAPNDRSSHRQQSNDESKTHPHERAHVIRTNSQDQRTGSTVEESPNVQMQESNSANPLKRRFEQHPTQSWLYVQEDVDIAKSLPPQPLLEKVADFFCVTFHHWIPFLNKRRLQTRVREGVRDTGTQLVLHALVAICLRHMGRDALFLDEDEIRQQTKLSRVIVETHALRNVSVESLQALICLVFNFLNDGQTHRAWPLIGSLTRTIDYLQLTTEPTSSQSGSLMTPVRLVAPSNDWTELEERRRLFWIVFLLDRFCSVSTGWNTSLTADDVHRRLPADGGYFTREEPVITPYFGIWNKAAARIGRSLAHVPAQYNEEDPTVEQHPGTGASPSSANGFIDASKLGAFAYCVEATESLSQVTTFFLQQRINWQDKEHAISWLTRFKELDLRLVNWKIFLPPRWKDSNISSDTTVIDMDPNLTLAHITHNTSMILLHHPIAYPPSAWKDYVALPKECSAQTCVLAAVETSNIVDKFLAHTLIPFVNVQFAFCAYVAAKALLFEHQSTKRPLRPEFQNLIRNLWDMSSRWRGKSEQSSDAADVESGNQPGTYAANLGRLFEACQHDPHFRFNFYDHSGLSVDAQSQLSPAYVSTPMSHRRSGSVLHEHTLMSIPGRSNSLSGTPAAPSPLRRQSIMTTRTENTASPVVYEHQRGSIMPGSMLSPGTMPPMYTSQHNPTTYQNNGQHMYHPGPSSAPTPSPTAPYPVISGAGKHQSVQDQSLINLSDAFMDSQFLDMDRVITFEDANFFLPGDAFRWQ